MSGYFVAPIVEGHGEVEAVPILLRRLFAECRPQGELQVNRPLRVKAGSFLHDAAYFSRYLELAARKARQHPAGSVLILLDCEDDCPAEVGPRLAGQARAQHPDLPVTVTLAYREFETWFLAAAASLRGKRGLPPDLASPDNPEMIRDAKGWLSSRMDAPYNEPNDQPAFTNIFSFEQAMTAASFTRLRSKMHVVFSR
jgi:hypothetical protein